MSSRRPRYDALPATDTPSNKQNAFKHESRRYTQQQPSGNASSTSHNKSNTAMYTKAEDVPSKSPGTRPPRTGRILTLFLLMLLPLALSAVLIYLVYTNLLHPAPEGLPETYTPNDGKPQALSSGYYYVEYSSTSLVFISSLASTLALALVPVGMALYSFITASSFERASKAVDPRRLPTPYQLDLYLCIISGGALDFWRYLQYVAGRGKRRTTIPPILQQASLMLGLMLLLAVCVTAVDALLHIKTSTVTYNTSISLPESQFDQGRRLPTECWNVTEVPNYACNINPGGSGAESTLLNSSEAYLTLGNASARNFVQMTDDGKTSIIVPSQHPSGQYYAAQSFGSATTCQTVTSRCQPHYYGGCDACQVANYSCTAAEAGMVTNGTFGSTNTANSFSLMYFDNAKKDHNVTAPTSLTEGHLWTGWVVALRSAEFNYSNSAPINDMNYDPNFDWVATSYGVVYSILSCDTFLSEVLYEREIDASVRNGIMTAMNATTSAPFIQPFTSGYGDDNLNTGFTLAGASAVNGVDFTGIFARTLDRTLLSLTSGILPRRAPVVVYQSRAIQAAKVPVAEFIALIILSMLTPAMGIVLAAWASIVSRRAGVAAAHLRLDTSALVANLFEDPNIGRSPTTIEDFFSELHGHPARRVMLQNAGNGDGRFVALHEDDSVK